MSPASIYRRVKLFRIAFGAHRRVRDAGNCARPGGVPRGLGGVVEGESGGGRARRNMNVRLSVRRLRIVCDMRLGQSARWTLNLYPQAGEGSGCFQSGAPWQLGWWWCSGVERAQAEAARRARGKVRRYCAASRLNRLGTLTYGRGLPRSAGASVGCGGVLQGAAPGGR